jgi:alkanesulfonate monooxygenase SsuD/methylene tetrahydromethanopterin reductase-like flavin-dependent oxidoreductase (luciferase family)
MSRYALLILPDAPFDTLVQRWQTAEALGFDAAYVADHTGDYRDLDGYWLDGWTVLAHMASATTSIRIGTLVSNPLLRHPVQLALQAVALDHLSSGRLELGIGTGIAGFDHDAVGEPYWTPRERAARFAEYVGVVDGVLRSPTRSFAHDGEYFRSRHPAMHPTAVQSPRPPLIVGGQSPTVLRVAAERGDCWNTHGPFGREVEEIIAVTAEQNRRLDDLCDSYGRPASAVRRSLLLFDALDFWNAPDRLPYVVARFAEVGIQEFVLLWPPREHEERLADVAETLQSVPADLDR